MKKVVAFLLSVLLMLSARPPAMAERTGEVPEDELERAIWYGFVPENLQGDYDKAITAAEYCTVIAPMIAFYDASKSDAWRRVSVLARQASEEITRDQGMLILFRAALAMDAAELDGDRMDENEQMRDKMPEPWDDFSWQYRWFPDWEEVAPDPWSVFQGNYATTAYSFSFLKLSGVSGQTFFDYDEASNSMRVKDPLTRREAILSVVRLYESTEIGVKTWWNLVTGAGEAPEATAAPEPTASEGADTGSLLASTAAPTPQPEQDPVVPGELEDALALGLDDKISDDQMTYQSYIAMLDRLVEIADASQLDTWKTRYPWARELDTPIDRSTGMYLTYCAAETLGSEYTQFTPDWRIHEKIGESVWDNYTIDWDIFTDAAEEVPYSGMAGYNRFVSGYFFSFQQYARRSGNPLFDYDPASNSMRPTDPFKQKEALLALARLYDAREMPPTYVPIAEMETYDKLLIPDTLLAQSARLPEPTLTKLPYYTGLHYERIKPGAHDYRIKDFQLLAQWGFNYVRLDVAYFNFFNEDVTQANIADFRRLDTVIRWALQYGLHISIQFSEYPGHLTGYNEEEKVHAPDVDFYTNEKKQQLTCALWAAVAKRYQGIPNNTLSFMFNHEPMNSARTTATKVPAYTDKDIERASKAVVAAIREVDPDRFLFYETKFDIEPDAFMADAGVAQGSFYALNNFVYWNLITDFEVSAGLQPNWPYYSVPQDINAGRPVRLEGFLPKGTRVLVRRLSDDKNSGTLVASAQGKEIAKKTFTAKTREIDFTLENDVSALDLKITKGGLSFRSISVFLPEEYATDKYYYPGQEEFAQSFTEIVHTSEIEIRGHWTDGYGSFSDTKDPRLLKQSFKLDDQKASVITIHQDGTFTTNYGCTRETMRKAVATYAAQLKELGAVGMNVELAQFTIPAPATYRYMDDVLAAFKEYGIGWCWYNAGALFDGWMTGAETEVMDGYNVDVGLLRILQKYQ